MTQTSTNPIQREPGTPYAEHLPRVIQAMPFHQYLAADGISQSSLKVVGQKSLAHYRYQREHPKEATTAMDVGTVAHMLLLEPGTESTRVAVSPYEEFRTKESKEWRARQEMVGKIVLKERDMERVYEMVEAATSHRLYSPIFESQGGMKEVSVFVRCPVTGLTRKARFDRVTAGGNALVDIKTTADASREGFGKVAWNLGYYRQAAWYLDAWNAAMPDDKRDVFGFFCIESEAPFVTAFWEVPEDLIEVGRMENARDLKHLAYAMKTDTWPGYNDQTDPTFLVPAWAAKVIDGMLEA